MQLTSYQQTPNPGYAAWLRSIHQPAQSRRTAEKNAAFLLPHLDDARRLIDAGCGAGSITLGLGSAVASGEVIGIDISEESLVSARALTETQGVGNVRFEKADVHALPFDDASFDAAFAHALLQHVESPKAALRELRRVLRPGGVIGVADADFDGSVLYPTNDSLQRATAILARTRRHPHIGKQLRELLHDAGFVSTEASATANFRGSANLTRLDGDFWARYFESEEFITHAESSGWASRKEILECAAAWRAWGEHPGAFSAGFWCQAIGWASK